MLDRKDKYLAKAIEYQDKYDTAPWWRFQTRAYYKAYWHAYRRVYLSTLVDLWLARYGIHHNIKDS